MPSASFESFCVEGFELEILQSYGFLHKTRELMNDIKIISVAIIEEETKSLSKLNEHPQYQQNKYSVSQMIARVYFVNMMIR